MTVDTKALAEVVERLDPGTARDDESVHVTGGDLRLLLSALAEARTEPGKWVLPPKEKEVDRQPPDYGGPQYMRSIGFGPDYDEEAHGP